MIETIKNNYKGNGLLLHETAFINKTTKYGKALMDYSVIMENPESVLCWPKIKNNKFENSYFNMTF